MCMHSALVDVWRAIRALFTAMSATVPSRRSGTKATFGARKTASTSARGAPWRCPRPGTCGALPVRQVRQLGCTLTVNAGGIRAEGARWRCGSPRMRTAEGADEDEAVVRVAEPVPRVERAVGAGGRGRDAGLDDSIAGRLTRRSSVPRAPTHRNIEDSRRYRLADHDTLGLAPCSSAPKLVHC